MKPKDLFSAFVLALLLISVGCGGGTGTDSGGAGTDSGGSTAQLVSISVTPADPSVPAEITGQLTAYGTYSDGTTQDITTQVTWISSDASVATVSSSGLASAVAPGTATVTATSRRLSGKTTFRVNRATLSSISVTPANPSVPDGNTKQFTASGIYSDGTSHNITTQVSWRSSNPSVATVKSSGLATAVAAGTATITATSRSTSGNTTIMVTPATLSSILLTPANPRVPAGTNRQFAASGTYSDGTTQEITTHVTWTSSNTPVATVDSSGLVTAAAAGTTTITAASPSISGNTTLTATDAGTITLAWDPPTTRTDGSPVNGLGGYRIYYGRASGTYDHSIDVGNVTTHTFTSLTPGQTYYIAATAYDPSNNQSAYSNEVIGMPK